MRKQSAILCFVALIFSACGTVNVAPLDDAYYWPDKNAVQVETAEASPVTDNPSPVTPTIEYIDVQDTVVTIRVTR